jgi:hypothetical protein
VSGWPAGAWWPPWDTWPRTAAVYLHPVWPDERPDVPQIVERVPVRSCVRRVRRSTSCWAGPRRTGRPATPNDQAWIESLFSPIQGEHPHLEAIRDPDRVRREHNEVRLHAAIGYVTPDDEHHGRGEAIRPPRRTPGGSRRPDQLPSTAAPQPMITSRMLEISTRDWFKDSDTPRHPDGRHFGSVTSRTRR